MSRRPTNEVSDHPTAAASGAAIAVIASSLAIGVVMSGQMLGAVVPTIDLETAGLVPLDEVVADQPAVASVVLAADGTVIGQFRPQQRFRPVAPESIPAVAATAVIAAEDPTFFDHHGFVPSAILRAAVKDVLAGEVVEGGSTITQQLAKNLYTDQSATLRRKAQELSIAIELERRYSKHELLAAYLNTVYLGDGNRGIRAAARDYFRKNVEDLTLGEAALLAGLIPAPTARNPRRVPEAAEAARQEVLDRVLEAGLADAALVDEARSSRPTVEPRLPSEAAYPYFVEFVRWWLEEVEHLPPAQVRSGGLRIETTLDRVVQDAALEQVRITLPGPGPTAALVTADHRNGHLLAMVGGSDWGDSEVNLALGAIGGGSGRQPGSSFKPFALAAALEQGWRLGDRIPAPEAMEVPGADEPIRNYTRRGYGRVTLAEATRRSINTAYAKLALDIGPDAIRDVATRAGVTGLPDSVGPAIALGAWETSPLDMARAYGTLAEEGRRIELAPIRRVVAPDGTVLVDRTVPEPQQVIDPSVARRVTGALIEVIEGGTGVRAAIDRPAAGKTGTSDDYANAWFAGYTAQLVTVVWVGDPSGNVAMHDVAGYEDVTGGSVPADLWREVMTVAHRDLPIEPLASAPPLPARAPRSSTTSSTTSTSTSTTTTSTSTTSTTTTSTTTTSSTTTTTQRPTTSTTARPATTTTTTTTRPPATSTTTTSTTRPPPSSTTPTTTTTPPPLLPTTEPPRTEVTDAG